VVIEMNKLIVWKVIRRILQFLLAAVGEITLLIAGLILLTLYLPLFIGFLIVNRFRELFSYIIKRKGK